MKVFRYCDKLALQCNRNPNLHNVPNSLSITDHVAVAKEPTARVGKGERRQEEGNKNEGGPTAGRPNPAGHPPLGSVTAREEAAGLGAWQRKAF